VDEQPRSRNTGLVDFPLEVGLWGGIGLGNRSRSMKRMLSCVGGAGLTRTVTGESLLRDRLASNVALTGEQELANAAYAQNMTVTLPANTRFCVVLQKSAIAVAPTPAAVPARQAVEMPTVRNVRTHGFGREINRMYQESNSGLRGGKP